MLKDFQPFFRWLTGRHITGASIRILPGESPPNEHTFRHIEAMFASRGKKIQKSYASPDTRFDAPQLWNQAFARDILFGIPLYEHGRVPNRSLIFWYGGVKYEDHFAFVVTWRS
jgi:hypothetical protein